MHRRGNGSRNPFSDSGDPFAGFGGFGGFGGQRSLMSNFFGGRDPFDDPFFTRPFGGMFQSNIFGSTGNPFIQPFGQSSGFLEHHAPVAQRSTGPIIEELDSDDEKEDPGKEKRENPKKHGRSSNKPYVEDPEEDVQEKKSKYVQYGNDFINRNAIQSHNQARSFTFQSSSVTYGGSNGAYYTSSTTKRTGSDGVTFEESKEADSTTRQATHQISRGLLNKGHSLTRKLHSDGKVDSMQTLHNLNEDELAGFEDAWKVNAPRQLPGWRENTNGRTLNGQIGQGRLALPSPHQSESNERLSIDNRERQQGPSTSQGRRGRN